MSPEQGLIRLAESCLKLLGGQDRQAASLEPIGIPRYHGFHGLRDTGFGENGILKIPKR